MQIQGIFTKSYDKDGKTYYPFVVTSYDLDRDNEIIDLDTIIWDNFLKNPIIVFQHDSHGKSPIGNWSNLRRIDDEFWLDAYFDEQPDANGINYSLNIKNKIDAGSVKACSMGFIPAKTERLKVENDNVTLPNGKVIVIPPERQEQIIKWNGTNEVCLLMYCDVTEISIVNIPSNPNAIKKSLRNNMESHNSKDELENIEKRLSDLGYAKMGATISTATQSKLEQACEHMDCCMEHCEACMDECKACIDECKACCDILNGIMGNDTTAGDTSKSNKKNAGETAKKLDEIIRVLKSLTKTEKTLDEILQGK